MANLDIKLLYLLNDFAGKSEIFDRVIIFLANYLQYPLVALFLVAVYFGFISKSGRGRMLWTVLLSAAIARLGITELIRFFYHRPRPFLVYNDIHPLISINEYSFPSGHAAFFFALATAIYFYNKRWGAWFFIAAILISISRVIAGIHYPSDIIGGAIIGVAVGYLVFNYAYVFSKNKTRASNNHV